MRSLITGGAGFIGYHIGRQLADQEHEVVLLDSFTRGRRDQDLEKLVARPNVSLVAMDIEAPGVLGELEGSFDRVYHLAAVIGVQHVVSDPGRVLRVNARTALNVLDFVVERACPKLFFASTSEAYAWSMRVMDLPIPTPEDVPLAVDSVANRRASYALSKVFGEMAFVHGVAQTNTQLISARFHNVFGPRMGTAHVIPELYLRMASGERPTRVPEATATRAFCYIDDALEAIELLMSSDNQGVYNVGNDTAETMIADVAKVIASVAGLEEEDLSLDMNTSPAIPRRCPDITRLRAAGFEPSIELEEGIRKTIDWYQRNQVPIGV